MKALGVIFAILFIVFFFENTAMAGVKYKDGAAEGIAITAGLAIAPIVLGLTYLSIDSACKNKNRTKETALEKPTKTHKTKNQYLDRVLIFYSNNPDTNTISIGIKF